MTDTGEVSNPLPTGLLSSASTPQNGKHLFLAVEASIMLSLCNLGRQEPSFIADSLRSTALHSGSWTQTLALIQLATASMIKKAYSVLLTATQSHLKHKGQLPWKIRRYWLMQPSKYHWRPLEFTSLKSIRTLQTFSSPTRSSKWLCPAWSLSAQQSRVWPSIKTLAFTPS